MSRATQANRAAHPDGDKEHRPFQAMPDGGSALHQGKGDGQEFVILRNIFHPGGILLVYRWSERGEVAVASPEEFKEEIRQAAVGPITRILICSTPELSPHLVPEFISNSFNVLDGSKSLDLGPPMASFGKPFGLVSAPRILRKRSGSESKTTL
jgi:hypothetical protein